MVSGSCLCGAVTYEVAGTLEMVTYCWCSRCRKASGSAFAANATARAEHFRFTSGEELLTTFSVDGRHRQFCSKCGSPITSRRDAMPGVLRLRLGSLDTPIAERPMLHAYIASKADWCEVPDDGLPRFADVVPGYPTPDR